MLLGAAYAGIAIDNCSAALAHNISHALAALGPVHHGLATALALEVILPWQVAADDARTRRSIPDRRRRRGRRGVRPGRDATGLAESYAELLTRCGIEPRLPPGFAGVGAATLAAAMRAPEPGTCASPRRAR